MEANHQAKHLARPTDEPTTSEGPQARRFGIFLKVFGVLAILDGIQKAVAFALVTLVFGLATAEGLVLDRLSTVTTAIAIAAFVLLTVNATAEVILGVRLLRGKHRGVALACEIMGILQALLLACHFMLDGLATNAISSVVTIVFLSILQTYADPTLRQEREAARSATELQNKADQEAGTLGRDKTGRGYLRMDFFNVFWIFTVSCVVGLVLEVIWHMTVVDPGVYQDRAGLLYGPFSPIYGFGAVIITMMLNRLWKANVLVQFLVAAVVGAAFEFAVSYWMEFSFGITAWDYSNYTLPGLGIPDPIAVMCGGRTSTMFLFIWGILGIVWLHMMLPLLLRIINAIPWNWRYAVTAVCAALMLVDGTLTVASYDCWYQRQAGLMDQKQQTAIDQFCNAHYDDSFMEHRFQSMTMNPDKATRMQA